MTLSARTADGANVAKCARKDQNFDSLAGLAAEWQEWGGKRTGGFWNILQNSRHRSVGELAFESGTKTSDIGYE